MIFWCNVQWSMACYALDHLPMVLGSPTDRGLHGPQNASAGCCLRKYGEGGKWSLALPLRLRLVLNAWAGLQAVYTRAQLDRVGLWRDSTSTLSFYTEACSTDPPHLHCQESVSPQPQRTSQLTMFWNCKLRWSLGWVSQVFCHRMLWKGNTWCS